MHIFPFCNFISQINHFHPRKQRTSTARIIKVRWFLSRPVIKKTCHKTISDVINNISLAEDLPGCGVAAVAALVSFFFSLVHFYFCSFPRLIASLARHPANPQPTPPTPRSFFIASSSCFPLSSPKTCSGASNIDFYWTTSHTRSSAMLATLMPNS